jgi:hypothetical protein
MSYRTSLLAAALCLAMPASAVAAPSDSAPEPAPFGPVTTTQAVSAPDRSSPIQDNSLLVEEAYNQEDGVIQHITFFQKLASTGDWVLTQTDEWPLRSLKHQLSMTVAATHSTDFPGSGTGWGDTAVNYRYQLVGSGETRVAIAPRITALLPTGDHRLGRGYGGAGIQLNLPISIQHNQYFVTHWNFGTTWIPSAQNALGQRAGALSANLGQSVVWLVKPRFNALVETVWTSTATVVVPGKTVQQRDLYISPGIRWAYNFKSGLQIVPGLGVPIGVGSTSRATGVLMYLSFEHELGLAHSRN